MIGPVVAQSIPEKCLAIVRISGPIHVRRAERDHRESVALVHAEQRPFAHGLVPHVGIRMIVGRQRIALVVVQTVAVGRHARHVDVALQPVAARFGGRFHLRSGRAAMPVVDVVVHDVEPLAGQRCLQCRSVIAVGNDLFDPLAQVVPGLAMQDRDLVLGFQQRRVTRLRPMKRVPPMTSTFMTIYPNVSPDIRLVVIFKTEVRDQIFAAHPAQACSSASSVE